MIVPVTTVSVLCPYCGQSVELLVEGTLPNQQYVEDCQVCCQPMLVKIDTTADEPVVNVSRENE